MNALLFGGAALLTYESLSANPTEWLACALLGAMAGGALPLWLPGAVTLLEKARV